VLGDIWENVLNGPMHSLIHDSRQAMNAAVPVFYEWVSTSFSLLIIGFCWLYSKVLEMVCSVSCCIILIKGGMYPLTVRRMFKK